MHRAGKGLIFGAVGCLLLAASARWAPSVSTWHEQRVVDLSSVVPYLAAEWDKEKNNPRQNERGYCIRFSESDSEFVKIYSAVEIKPGLNVAQNTPYSISYQCLVGWVHLHVHTPVTCKVSVDTLAGVRSVNLDTCVLGGGDAYNSNPSDPDWDLCYFTWRKYKIPFHIIQWDRSKFRVYSPWDN